MRKSLLIAIFLVVLTVSPSFAIYREDGEQPTPKEGEAMLMSTSNAMQAKDVMKETKTTAKDSMVQARDAMKEKFAQAREEFKEKLKGIKDARKQKAITNIDERITEKNKKHTDHMSGLLGRFTLILSKYTAKEAEWKAAGKNTTALAADIAAASEAIETAKTAVAEQAAKEYIVDVTTEEELREEASAVIKQFMTDLKAVHQLVVAAQKAVVKVARTAAALEGAATTVTPTSTP